MRTPRKEVAPKTFGAKVEILTAIPGSTVTCAHLWLLRPPDGVTHSGVWGVVAAAAIAAMHSGRKNLVRLHLKQEELVGVGQTVMTDFFPIVSGSPLPSVMQRATRWAAAWFWCLLQDFTCSQRGIPSQWAEGLPANHPFIMMSGSPPALSVHLI